MVQGIVNLLEAIVQGLDIMALSPAQRKMFFERGTLRLTCAFPDADAARMDESIWGLLGDKYGVRREDSGTWTEKQPTGFQSLTRAGAFNSIVGSTLVDALNNLLGYARWRSTVSWGAPLVTFPERGRAWDVPKNQWHLDFPARGGANELPGVRVLGFIAPVEVGGGGTVVVTGSHRLVEHLVRKGLAHDGHSPVIRDSLASAHPWFRRLWSETALDEDRVRCFMTDGENIDGVNVRVEELTGATGDVILMHPWAFHAPAPNCSLRPRMMVSQSVFRKA